MSVRVHTQNQRPPPVSVIACSQPSAAPVWAASPANTAAAASSSPNLVPRTIRPMLGNRVQDSRETLLACRQMYGPIRSFALRMRPT
ncbi:MAG: hypothetical protein JWN03_4339 [Nocardia sp.]|nr:hypothetical protein [Nocardia sp.]